MTRDGQFFPIRVSSKFAICGLPLTVDSYRTCSFGCRYCFANERVIMPIAQEALRSADVGALRRKLVKIFERGEVNQDDFLGNLIFDKITWHFGGLSDPFQPCEARLGVTKAITELARQYGITILYSTKTDTVDWSYLDPDFHAFQLSITNTQDRRDIEPNVPAFQDRHRFYRELKDRGFKVGIRLQPFIPGVTGISIIEAFHDADYYSIEGLKLVPQNREQRQELLKLTGLQPSDFTQMGLLNIKPHIRERLYRPIISELDARGIPYSIADNDMHHISKSSCCCGSPLIRRSTTFNNTALYFAHGDYSKDMVLSKLGKYADCRANHLFTSNRQEGLKTVRDFITARFGRESSPFSKKFLYGHRENGQTSLDEGGMT
jgi:DNA repair photolyase